MTVIFPTKMTAKRAVFGSKSALFVASATVLTVLSGCAATAPQVTRTTAEWEQRATARALERWQHISDGQFAKAYAFHSAASRALMNLDSFERNMKNLAARGAGDAKATCDQSICEVQLSVSVAGRIPRIGARSFQIPHKESWVIADGEVWFVQK